jgi:uncharacterized protein (DUF488 family)
VEGGVVRTIGHSGHATAELIALLSAARIEVVVDVRSAPYSRIHPQHAKGPLSSALEAAGIDYRFAGRHLGGRPDDLALYDDAGHVRYDLLAGTPSFEQGIDRVVELARTSAVALLCAEEDPTGCHRRRLVGRVLLDRGLEVEHLRGDGSTTPEADLAEQLALFDAWRSAVPVREGLR